jgi:hypothetical protein
VGISTEEGGGNGGGTMGGVDPVAGKADSGISVSANSEKSAPALSAVAPDSPRRGGGTKLVGVPGAEVEVPPPPPPWSTLAGIVKLKPFNLASGASRSTRPVDPPPGVRTGPVEPLEEKSGGNSWGVSGTLFFLCFCKSSGRLSLLMVIT